MTPASARLSTANRVLLARTPHGRPQLHFQQPGATRMVPWDTFAGLNLSRLVLDPDTLSAMTPWLDVLEKDVNALRYGQPPLLPLLAYAQHAPDFVLMPLLHQRIINLQRNARVLALGKRFFPNAAYLFFPEKSWSQNLMFLLEQIEHAGWFRIDWDLIELARVLDEEDVEHTVTGDSLANYLQEIPVMCYAPTATEASSNPAVAWLKALLCGEWESLTFEKLADFGIDPTRLPDPSRIRHAVATTAFRQYTSPLAFIPAVARVICRSTGNLILDSQIDPGGDGPSERFTWSHDVPRLRQAWLTAAPIAAQLHHFYDWCSADERNLWSMVNTLLTVAGY